MDWSALVSLVAVGVAGLSVWVSYQERVVIHRQAIYLKQMEVHSELTKRCAELMNELRRARDGYPMVGIPEDSERRLIYETARQAYNEIERVFDGSLLFVSSSVAEAGLGLTDTWHQVTQESEWLDSREVFVPEMVHACYCVIRAARTSLGIEPISREIQPVVRRTKPTEA